MHISMLPMLLTAMSLAPSAQQPHGSGLIRGIVRPARTVKAIFALDRSSGKKFQARISTDGQFVIESLRLGGRYDLRIVTVAGVVEGVDLGPHERLPAPPGQRDRKFTAADADRIRQIIRAVPRFADQVRIVLLRGFGPYATALVEKVRTRPFHGMHGSEVIWRMELWYFAWRYGDWVRLRNVEKVLVRRRMQRSDFDRMTWVFDPRLGGLIAQPADSAKVISIVLGPQFRTSNGRLGKDFDPAVFGSPTASQPASPAGAARD